MNSVGIKPYTIIEKHQLGIIGVITPDTKGTSSGAGPGTEFSDPIVAVQTAVDELRAQNITRIIALTHIGYDKDIELAQKTRGVDLVCAFIHLRRLGIELRSRLWVDILIRCSVISQTLWDRIQPLLKTWIMKKSSSSRYAVSWFLSTHPTYVG